MASQTFAEYHAENDYNRAKNWTGFGKAPYGGAYYAEQDAIAEQQKKAAEAAAKAAASSSSRRKSSGGSSSGGSSYSPSIGSSGLGGDALAEYSKDLAAKKRGYTETAEDARISWQNEEDLIRNGLDAENLQASLNDDVYNAYARMLVSHYG